MSLPIMLTFPDKMLLAYSLEFFKLACVVLLLVYYLFTHSKTPKRNLPPGPFCLPFIGYFPFLTRKPFLKFLELKKKYGGVFSLYLGGKYTVVLGDTCLIKEAFSKPEFLGRPPRTALSPDGSRISMSIISGNPWQEQRRFFLHSMKDLGLGKSRMEEHIKDELLHFITAIEIFRGQPIEIKKFLASSTTNMIFLLTYGKRLDYDGKRRIILDADLESITNFMGQTAIQGYLPWLLTIPGVQNVLGYERFRKSFRRTLDFIVNEIDTHRESLESSNVRDFIDDYLLEIESQKENPCASFHDRMLEGNVMMLFLAGSETIRTTIDWTFYIMAAFPDVQKKVQKEIDDVIGRERMPTYLDHKDMVFTQSVLLEVQRWRPAIPINLQRYTLADTEINGYFIPKGSVVLANIWGVHHDPQYWKNPDEFCPTRFLSEDQKSVIKSENFLPFAIGKRSCPGQSLAVVELFLYTTTVLQRFDIHIQEGHKVNFDGVLAIVNQPRRHELCFSKRF